jgi:hypothetical protein
MATRDTAALADMFAWEPLSAPSSIYPVRPELQPHASAAAAPHELSGLVPFGCEAEETGSQDPG